MLCGVEHARLVEASYGKRLGESAVFDTISRKIKHVERIAANYPSDGNVTPFDGMVFKTNKNGLNIY